MRNLAGDQNCSAKIREELKRAKIEIIEHPEPLKSEVPSLVTGKLRGFTFERAWYYYIVAGIMPIETARELYDDPIGKTDIRVFGHCGCPAPDEWAEPYNKNLDLCIPLYHIDSEAGLRIFADAIRRLPQ